MTSTIVSDDRSFATGVKTSGESTVINMISRKLGGNDGGESGISDDPIMDRTQRSHEEGDDEEEESTNSGSPIKICFARPRLCNVHLKTVSHVVPVAILFPLLYEMSLLVSKRLSDDSHFRRSEYTQMDTIIILNSLTILSCSVHAILLCCFRAPTLRSVIGAFWSSAICVLLIVMTGCFIWQFKWLNIFGIVFQLHMLCLTGATFSLVLTILAVNVELQAVKYAIVY